MSNTDSGASGGSLDASYSKTKGIILASAAAAGLVLSLALFYPGLMTHDSWAQYAQVMTHQIYNHHPPAMVYLWRFTETFLHGSGGLFALHAAMYWLGVGLITNAFAVGLPKRLAIVAMLGLFPPSLVLLGVVVKDAGVLASFTLGVGLVLTARRRPNWLFLGLAWLALFYGSAVRHNSFLAALPLLYVVARIMLRDIRNASPCSAEDGRGMQLGTAFHAPILTLPLWGRGCTYTKQILLTLALAGTMQLGIYYVNNVNVRLVALWPSLAVWDMAGISLIENKMLLPDYVRVHADFDLARLESIFSPYTNPSLCMAHARGREVLCREHFPLIRPGPTLAREDQPQLLKDWIGAIRNHPAAYLEHRLRLMTYLLGLHEPEGWQPIALENMEQPDSPVLAEALATTDITWARHQLAAPLKSIFYGLERTWLFKGWPYLLILLWLLLACWRCREEKHRLGFCLALSGLLYAAPLFVLAGSLDFRYLVWSIEAALLAGMMYGLPLRPAIGTPYIKPPGEGSVRT